MSGVGVPDIKLDDKVQDTITGFTGIAICYAHYLSGCKRWLIQPQELHNGRPIEAEWFDAYRIEAVTKKATKAGFMGGPQKYEPEK